jgi:hypothetical protein
MYFPAPIQLRAAAVCSLGDRSARRGNGVRVCNRFAEPLLLLKFPPPYLLTVTAA